MNYSPPKRLTSRPCWRDGQRPDWLADEAMAIAQERRVAHEYQWLNLTDTVTLITRSPARDRRLGEEIGTTGSHYTYLRTETATTIHKTSTTESSGGKSHVQLLTQRLYVRLGHGIGINELFTGWKMRIN